jgi:pimeloyl-ACP methyl ester carboxylesterase
MPRPFSTSSPTVDSAMKPKHPFRISVTYNWQSKVALIAMVFAFMASSPSVTAHGSSNVLAKGAVLTMNKLQQPPNGHYAAINGLNLYYEIHGKGHPLVLLHGGGSTIDSTFGRILSTFAKTHQVIAIELQAHGHTKDIDRVLSFEQDADDVDTLLAQLHIEKADIMGFSNGGTTALQIAIRHAPRVNKLILASATYKRDGMQPGFFDGMQHASLDAMPLPLKQAYLAINPDEKGLQAMFERDKARMIAFKDIADADIKAIDAPVLVLNGDAEVVRPEHALLLARTLPHGSLAILPGGHGDYIGELSAPDRDGPVPVLVVTLIEKFLSRESASEHR